MRTRLGGRRLLAATAVALVALSAPAAASGSSGRSHGRVFRFHDPAIAEASALVAQDGLFVTANDSGDTGRVFSVDGRGRTVGVTHWSRHPVDTEALAPGGPGAVWVGDIGDNDAVRSSVAIARVPVGRGDRRVSPTTYRLRYPDGAADAETLMREPATGRLYLATKSIFGGVLYAVPARLSATRTNRLIPVGRVLPEATDGAFFPDGRHLVVRSYTTAVVYSWPSLQPVGSFGLPLQRQGEGIAIAADGGIFLSSEGADSAVVRVELPDRLATLVDGVTSSRPATGTPGPSPESTPSRLDDPPPDPSSHDPWPWAAGGLLGLLALVVLLLSLRRPRSSRR